MLVRQPVLDTNYKTLNSRLTRQRQRERERERERENRERGKKEKRNKNHYQQIHSWLSPVWLPGLSVSVALVVPHAFAQPAFVPECH